MTTRRTFLLKILPAAGAAAVLGNRAIAAPIAVKETDPMAVALGYKTKTSAVDKAKYPKHKPDQTCLNCALYQGGTKPVGPCTLFAGKTVTKDGWCMSWAKKA